MTPQTRFSHAGVAGNFLRSSPFLSLLDEAPLARFGLEESDADGEGEGEDSMDKAQKIW